MSLALLLAELEVAADAETEAGERAIEAVRERLRSLSAPARSELARVLATQLAATDALRTAAIAERDRMVARFRTWAEDRPNLPGLAERIAECERAVTDADAVVYEYEQLGRELARLSALLRAERS